MFVGCILQLIQTYRSFGNEEIALAKKRILENQEILRKVKALQHAEQQAAEEHMLQALRKTVTQMQEVKGNAESLRQDAETQRQKLQEILSSLDMEALLRGTEQDKKKDE